MPTDPTMPPADAPRDGLCVAVSAPEGENGPLGVRVATDAADGRVAVPLEVWIAGTADAFVVHATEEGAKRSAIEAWQGAMDHGDPDGPYSWLPIDGADGAFELVIREGEFRTLHPGFQVHRAPVRTP